MENKGGSRVRFQAAQILIFNYILDLGLPGTGRLGHPFTEKRDIEEK